MNEIGKLYTSGQWTVKPGNEQEFIRVWQDFVADALQKKVGIMEAKLLQNQKQPNRFVSFGRWESQQQMDEWLTRPEFKKLISDALALSDLAESNPFKVVVHSQAD